MGWKLAQAAHKAALTHLTPRARLALDYMCWTALDDPRRGQASAEYWGGHIGIAASLVGLEDAPTNRGKLAAKRAISELLDTGQITQVREAAPGRNACYRILIGDRYAPPLPVENSRPEEPQLPLNGGHQ